MLPVERDAGNHFWQDWDWRLFPKHSMGLAYFAHIYYVCTLSN